MKTSKTQCYKRQREHKKAGSFYKLIFFSFIYKTTYIFDVKFDVTGTYFILISVHKSSCLAVNWTLQGPAMLEVSLSDNSNGYFIGAIIALAASIFSAANNIIMAKLGRGVPTSVQVDIL